MLFIKDRVDESVEILKQFHPDDGYYLAFSGGKDSVVLFHLAKMAGVKFDAHYNITTADPPEVVRFIREKYPTIEHDRPMFSMWELIPQHLIPPTRLARYCCEHLKETGGESRVVLTGVKRSDSTMRRRTMVHTCWKNGKVVVNPLVNWCDDEIWDFINKNNIDYCKLYDEGFDRIGCIGCPFGGPVRQRAQFNRWPKFRELYIKAFERMLEARRRRGLKTSWQTSEDVMSWWLSEENPRVPIYNEEGYSNEED